MPQSTISEDLESLSQDFPKKVLRIVLEDGWGISDIVKHLIKQRAYPSAVIVLEGVAYAFIKWNES